MNNLRVDHSMNGQWNSQVDKSVHGRCFGRPHTARRPKGMQTRIDANAYQIHIFVPWQYASQAGATTSFHGCLRSLG